MRLILLSPGFEPARNGCSTQRTSNSRSINFRRSGTRAGRLRAQYVDSGDASFLQRQQSAVGEFRNSLAALQRLIYDNVSQVNNWQQLKKLTNQRISLMDQAIELKRSGRSTLENQASIVRELTAASEATDQILQRMYDEEQRLLEERQKRERSSFSVIAGVLATSLFLALVLFLVHHQLLADQVRERVRAEVAQRALSARLLTLQDEERRILPANCTIHGQHLAALKMAISMLEAKSPGDNLLKDCLKLLDDSIAETPDDFPPAPSPSP